MPAHRVNTRDSYVTLGCSGVTAVVAWCCLVYATAVCDFLVVTGTDETTGSRVSIDRGIWNTQDPSFDNNLKCRGVAKALKDSRWKASEAMSIIACLIGGFAVLPLVCACGKKLRMSQTLSMSAGCMKATLFTGLTLLMKTSKRVCNIDGVTNSKCELGDGANMAITATVLFFVASIAINCAFARALIEQQQEGQNAAASGGDVEKGDEPAVVEGQE